MPSLQGERCYLPWCQLTQSEKAANPPVHPSPWCVRLKAHPRLLTLSGDRIKYITSPWKLNCRHVMWRCSCYCLWPGDRTRCLLGSPSGGVLKHWAPLNRSFRPIHAHQTPVAAPEELNHFRKKDLVNKHCFCFATRMSYAWTPMRCLLSAVDPL